MSASDAAGPLATLGVDARSERVYRLLLRHPGFDETGLATRAGLSPVELAAAVHPLLVLGLVRRDLAGGYVAAAPDVALDLAVEAELAGLEERRRQLERARAAASDFAAEHLAGQNESWGRASVDLVTGAAVTTAFEDLSRSVGGDLLIAHDIATGGSPWDPDVDRVTNHYVRLSRPIRCLYPVDALADPARARFVAAIHSRGPQVRLLDAVPVRLAIFGEVAAIVSPPQEEPRDPATVHLVVRSVELVRLLRTLFDTLWRSGIPHQRDAMAFDEDRRRLLELLATGLKDEAIARHLSVSLRTVRRRVADLLDHLGVQTRFQAGVEATRRGHL